MKTLEKILDEIDNMIDENCLLIQNSDSRRKTMEKISETTGLLRAKNLVINYLNNISGEDNNVLADDWIPVEERIPEDGTYLCTLDGELCGIEEPFTGMCGIENGIWDEPDCVIAWRPLPEPYKPAPESADGKRQREREEFFTEYKEQSDQTELNGFLKKRFMEVV